uniref:Chromosome 1 open reading frame 173 n=1 Tax=Nothobranchius korthausae TaxID=1143690 RepID=A0A1A8FLG0_9TELE
MQRPVRLKPIHSASASAPLKHSSPYRLHDPPPGNDLLFNQTEPPWLRSSIHQTKVHVNMVYFGKTVHLSNDLIDTSDEVRVFQQHCGGENLCVFRGYLQEGETFQFISRRHRGFPFSLTFYLNGLQVERLSSCCEFKHKKSSRLGGRHGHFGFSSVEGAAPCYRCILAMGLDTKPTPPPKRKKEVSAQEQSADSPDSPVDAPEMDTERTQEDAASRSESDTSPTRDPETRNKEQTAPVGAKGRDDYEEDFEADDEGPVEEATVKGTSPSPFNHTEKKEEKEASETDDDITSHSGSSSSGSDQEESDSEGIKDEKEDVPEEDQEEAASPTDETEEPQTQVPAATKEETVLDSAGDSTEIEISETSVPSGSEDKQNNDNSEDKTHEDTGDGNKEEDEQERVNNIEEQEETENDENNERAENQSIKEEPEAEVDVKSQEDEKRNASDMASEEKDDEAGKPGEVETENKESDNNEGEETTEPQTQNEEADDGGQTVSVRTDIPEALADEDNTDMVTNWIKMHQSSKYFETFVEPLDDLREEDSDLKESGTNEETPSKELAGSERPLKMKEDEEEPKDKTPTETEETRGEDDQNNEQTNDALLENETNEVKTSLQGEEMDNGTEEQDGPEKESQSNMFTKVESLLGDVTAGSVFEDESGES